MYYIVSCTVFVVLFVASDSCIVACGLHQFTEINIVMYASIFYVVNFVDFNNMHPYSTLNSQIEVQLNEVNECL